MSEHFINKCSCGKVISQCRCIGEKTEKVIENGCDECKAKAKPAQAWASLKKLEIETR